MAGLPIVKMTLYKHGVGFFTRRGEVAGEAVSLSFRVDEMNDVLKSLTAVALGGGQVRGVDYDTPEDKATRLARSSIKLSDDASLRDLLRDLRGRRVEASHPQRQAGRPGRGRGSARRARADGGRPAVALRAGRAAGAAAPPGRAERDHAAR